MSRHEANFDPASGNGDPTLLPIQQLIETMGGTVAEQHTEPIVFETAEAAATLEQCIRRIVQRIEADAATPDAEARTSDAEEPADARGRDYRHLKDYDIIDLDAVPDNANALYVATADDLRAVLTGTYEALGFTEEMFLGFGLTREQFINSIIKHEEKHAEYARLIRRQDIRFSMLIRPAQDLDKLTAEPTGEFAGYEPVVQVDLGGQITKLEYAAIVVGADPSAEDRTNIRRVFGYSSVREVIARMQHHNRDGFPPHLPLPEWFEDWQRSA